MRPCACDKLELVRDQSRQRNAESVPDITLSLSFEFSGSECAWALCDLSHRQGCFSALHSERLCHARHTSKHVVIPRSSFPKHVFSVLWKLTFRTDLLLSFGSQKNIFRALFSWFADPNFSDTVGMFLLAAEHYGDRFLHVS